MISIKINEHAVTVSGHAGAGPPGQDIVCAAVSALTQTLAAALENLTDNQIWTVKDNGYMSIRFRNLSESGKLLIDSFFMGISGIAESYPDCINIKEAE